MSGRADMAQHKPLMIQCDFDGTVTIGDLSFQILDDYTDVPWRQWFDDFKHGKITVNDYNAKAFAYVTASKKELQRYSVKNVRLRPGLSELLTFCKDHDLRFVFVSNGMTFYIEAILNLIGFPEIEYHAADCEFKTPGVRAVYHDPNGKAVRDGFKEAYAKHFLKQGYRVAYFGNGLSDFKAASMCDYIYGIENLAEECDKRGVAYKPFDSLSDVINDLLSLL